MSFNIHMKNGRTGGHRKFIKSYPNNPAPAITQKKPATKTQKKGSK